MHAPKTLPESHHGWRRWRGPAGFGFVVAITLSACPQGGVARSRHAPASPPATPQEQALTGGLVRLRAPSSTMIRVAASRFSMGSTEAEVMSALAECHAGRTDSQGRPRTARAWPTCREERFRIELRQHPVTLSSYWLDRTEVTVAAYEQCVRLRRCEPIPYAQGAMRFAHGNFPVSLVSHARASTYCRFRRARLPTEAEFERAARGVVGRRYPWGNLFNHRACNHGRLGWTTTDALDGFAELAPVGSFPSGRTPDGFLDLAGNVAEWVSDTFAIAYAEQARTNPTGPAVSSTTGMKVTRGGSYTSPAPLLRGAARNAAEPSTTRPTLGFRCARSARPR
jgi:sulfatase modifying factor 1